MKLSIIVPVYNGEKYLRECLDSIAKQSFEDFECILINDGSQDKSLEILNHYSEKDERFRVIIQENAGVSTARNNGIALAKGDYITFVDCDDYILSDTYKQVFDQIREDTDVFSFGLHLVSSKRREHRIVNATIRDIDSMFIHDPIYMHAPCNKVFRKTLLDNNRLMFNSELKYYEDMVFCFEAMVLAGNIQFTNDPLYCYRQNEQSATQRRNITALDMACTDLSAKLLRSFCREMGIEEDHKTFLEYREMCYRVFYLKSPEVFAPERFRQLNLKKSEWDYPSSSLLKTIAMKMMVWLANRKLDYLLKLLIKLRRLMT